MLTGRQTLARIEQAIAEVHGRESQIDQSLKSATDDAERLRRDRAAALKELARIKLDEIAAGRLVRDLDAAERRAVEILEERRHRLSAATDRRAEATRELEKAEAQRHDAAASVEAALDAVEALRAEAEARVQATGEWQAAKARFDAADKVAAEAEKKSAQSQSELATKKRPYDEDPLFVYLWDRRFGTAQYTAGNLVRMIDRKVAAFIGYADARANYAMLIEIPARLSEHARGKRLLADGEKRTLAAIEHDAMRAAGIDGKERALAEARHRLAALEAALDSRRAELEKLDESRAALLSESVPGYAEALETIAAGDAKDDIRTLYLEARRTATAADEQLVRRIDDIDQKLEALDREIAGLRQTARDLATRRIEVERTRDRFRTAGYDHPSATFGNDNQIGKVLAQVLEGVVRSGILWDILREGFRTRPPRSRPDFGAPTFPFPFPLPGGGDSGPAGGGWREPSTRGGWFPESPSRGGNDSDDFRTGGSF